MTKSVEDYLKTIYKCQQRVDEPIKTNTISDELKLSRASVTEMVQKLSDQGFLTYFPYKGVTLTKKGEQKGKEMLRRHRLIELYLHRQLELSISDVHPELIEYSQKIIDENTIKFACAKGSCIVLSTFHCQSSSSSQQHSKCLPLIIQQNVHSDKSNKKKLLF